MNAFSYFDQHGQPVMLSPVIGRFHQLCRELETYRTGKDEARQIVLEKFHREEIPRLAASLLLAEVIGDAASDA